jgi:hypothetical protein
MGGPLRILGRMVGWRWKKEKEDSEGEKKDEKELRA